MIVPHNNGGCDKHGSYISQHDVLHDVIKEYSFQDIPH